MTSLRGLNSQFEAYGVLKKVGKEIADFNLSCYKDHQPLTPFPFLNSLIN